MPSPGCCCVISRPCSSCTGDWPIALGGYIVTLDGTVNVVNTTDSSIVSSFDASGEYELPDYADAGFNTELGCQPFTDPCDQCCAGNINSFTLGGKEWRFLICIGIAAPFTNTSMAFRAKVSGSNNPAVSREEDPDPAPIPCVDAIMLGSSMAWHTPTHTGDLGSPFVYDWSGVSVNVEAVN